MKASIDVLNMAIGRRVAVLGNMGELGDTAEVLHAEVGTYAAQQNVDLVCGIGDLTHALVEEASKGARIQRHFGLLIMKASFRLYRTSSKMGTMFW